MEKIDCAKFGMALRQARRALDWTQQRTAEEVDLTVEFYARMERGQGLPSVPVLRRLCLALDLSADVALGLESGTESQRRPGVCRHCGEAACTFHDPRCAKAQAEHARALAKGMPPSGRWG